MNLKKTKLGTPSGSQPVFGWWPLLPISWKHHFQLVFFIFSKNWWKIYQIKKIGNGKKVFWPAFGCKQHPNVGWNTTPSYGCRHMSVVVIYRALGWQILWPHASYQFPEYLALLESYVKVQIFVIMYWKFFSILWKC